MSANRSAAGVGRWAGTLGGRMVRVWRGLPHERRLAAFASLGLFVTLFLPWYQETVIVPGTKGAAAASASVTGWGAFSFVEAAVLLVAAGVLTLLFQRGEDRAFHLPGGDGWVVMAAGGWACVLVIWRIFDKQTTRIRGPGASISGIEWGMFVALAGAAFLAYAGSRIRAAHQPEPPLPGDEFGLVPASDRHSAAAAAQDRHRASPSGPDQGGSVEERSRPPAPRRSGEGRAGPSAERPFFERPPGWLTARREHEEPPESDEAPTRRAREPTEPADEAPTRRAHGSGWTDRPPAPYAADSPREAPLPSAPSAARRRQSDEQLTIPLEPED